MADRTRPSSLTVAYPNAAGIDVAAGSHFVAVPADRDEELVRECASFTEDLERLCAWLAKCGVDVVAMESTGIYWIPLYELLESKGFTVHLVNARHVKNVSGRKSDVLDCQWLQQLMSFGLLSGAIRPAEKICELRSLSRQREMLVQGQTRHVQHVQKALAQMNVQLDQVISDVMGVTGQRIVRAILAGEHDTAVLSKLKHGRIQADEATIAKSLVGTWRSEHLFAIGQAVALYDAYQGQLEACDAELARVLASLAVTDARPPEAKRRARRAERAKLREALYRACGVDLTRIDGIDTGTAMKVLAEVGECRNFCVLSHTLPARARRLYGEERHREVLQRASGSTACRTRPQRRARV